ncbi:MAG: amino acid permease [Erysipelotrichaceae bacterium]|nr:amino acid permease [Erysipelotrichaceae bacterium]
MEEQVKNNELKPFMSPLAVWSLSIGTSIGWGSFVVTSNSYLKSAGPLGSILGMIVGAVVMLIISNSYHYLMNIYPDAGGVYTYAKKSLGYDFGFLSAWFTALTYLAIFWANVTSLPLFAKYFLGDIFRFGFSYSIFNYKVYFGEALLAIVAIVLTTLLCTNSRKAPTTILVISAITFTAGISVCFLLAMINMGKTSFVFDPLFIPDRSSVEQVMKIAFISPWAFIGFENISHMSEEFNFSLKKSYTILKISVIMTTLLYVMVIALSVTAYPEGYGSWLEYINDLSNIEGIQGLPAFYCAYYYLGNAGVTILMLSLLALILTSLIGNTTALSRLFYALGKDRVMPEKIGELNEKGIPDKAFWLVGAISILIPFIGRTAIGWIVDVTTIGAVIIYGLVSASAYKTAVQRKDKEEARDGKLGVIIMMIFAAFILLPSIFTTNVMAGESCFLFAIWATLGFFFFRQIIAKDEERRFGNSVVVWIAMLALIMFTLTIWMSDYIVSSADTMIIETQNHYVQNATADDFQFINNALSQLQVAKRNSGFVLLGMFGITLSILLNNYRILEKRARDSEKQLDAAKTQANTDPLTGVKSKRAYVEREKELNRQIKDGELDELAIVICDINNMKQINDTLGHKAGDECIRKTSRIICRLFKHSPVFRFGGDEFVVIMTDEDYKNRKSLMKKISDQAVENLDKDDIVIAAGMAEYDRVKDENVHAVFQRADDRMYKNKEDLKKKETKSSKKK